MNKTVSLVSVWLAAGTLAAMTVNVESTDPDRTITAGEVSTHDGKRRIDGSGPDDHGR